jgi:hypothetical protein
MRPSGTRENKQTNICPYDNKLLFYEHQSC